MLSKLLKFIKTRTSVEFYNKMKEEKKKHQSCLKGKVDKLINNLNIF